jgi:hypothetical protein
MDFKKWIFSEMPITKFQLLGQWPEKDLTGKTKKPRAYGYDPRDVGILTSPKGVEKIHRHWSNNEIDFEFYFLRSKEGFKIREVGEVSPEWVKENLGIDVPAKEDAMTVIFTQNIGAEKIPMTAWMIAHRLGHAIRRNPYFIKYFSDELVRDFRELLKEVYGIQKIDPIYRRNFSQIDEKELRALAYAVGTMKSAEKRNLVNFYEFTYELIAQWITTGKIKFKPLPKSFITKMRMSRGRPSPEMVRSKLDDANHEEYNEMLQGFADKYEDYLNSIFLGLVGKIFVM